MDDFDDMYDYFVPLTDKSDVGSCNDLDSGSEFGDCMQSHEISIMKFLSNGGTCDCCDCDQNSQVKKNRAPIKPRIENSEAGLTMSIKQTERECEKQRTREASLLPADDKIEDTVPPSPSVPSDCCHHKEPGGRRKFVVSFGANSANVGNDCLITERTRCQDFWKFIDSHPNLLELIREGEFVHSNPPHLLITPSVQRAMETNKKPGEILRARNKEVHDAEKERKEKRKRILEELQKKSGQAPFVRNDKNGGKATKKKKGGASTNSDKDSFKEILKEMTTFDKASGNPVSIGPTKGSNKAPVDKSQAKESTLMTDDEEEEDEL